MYKRLEVKESLVKDHAYSPLWLCIAGVSTALIVLQITVVINIFRHGG